MAVLRAHAKLDVGGPAGDADRPDNPAAHIGQVAVFRGRQRLGRRHHDTVPGVHAHRVHILHRGNNNGVVNAVSHHLKFYLFPTEHRLFHQYFADGAGFNPFRQKFPKFLRIVGGGTAGTAHSISRPQDERKTKFFGNIHPAFHRISQPAARDSNANLLHRFFEKVPGLGPGNRLCVGANALHAVLFQYPFPGQEGRQVKTDLTAQGGQERVRPFPFNDLLKDFNGQRFDVGAVRHPGVGHDGGRVGIDQNNPVTLLLERLAGLGTGIVKLAGLADDDGTGTDEKNLF